MSGHVSENCRNPRPWEFTAQFCGSAAPGQGFFYIKDIPCDKNMKDMSTLAVINVKQGEVTARQLEYEFKTLAGSNSTWRWFAKKIGANQYQMRFPTAQRLEAAAHFVEMRLRSDPSVVIEINKWSEGFGVKGSLQEAWFRVKGIPLDKRSIPNVCGSLVGLTQEVDIDNMSKFDYVRIRISCRNVDMVPAKVDGALGKLLYDFTFEREVALEGKTNLAGNQWVRTDGTKTNKKGDPVLKKQKLIGDSGQEDKQKSNTGAGGNQSAPPKFMVSAQMAYKDVFQEKNVRMDGSKAKVTEVEGMEDDSDDESMQLGDMVLPGSEKLNVGQCSSDTRDHDEGRKLWSVQCNAMQSVVINEYGSNMIKTKYDPLAAIEAKNAIQSAITDGKSKVNDAEMDMVVHPMIQEHIMQSVNENATSPSPCRGTQEEPHLELSRQENDVGMETDGRLEECAQKSLSAPIFVGNTNVVVVVEEENQDGLLANNQYSDVQEQRHEDLGSEKQQDQEQDVRSMVTDQTQQEQGQGNQGGMGQNTGSMEQVQENLPRQKGV